MLLPQSLSRSWFTAQTNLIEIYSYCEQYVDQRLAINWWLLALAILVIIYSRKFRLLFLAYFIGLGVFGLLGFSVFDHYLTGLMPVWAMITAQAIKRLPKLIGAGVITIFLMANLFQFSRVDNPYGLKHKKELVRWANQYLAGSNWALESESKCHRENGLRYLFELSGNPPVQSFMDPNFAWLYPAMPSGTAAEKLLMITDKPLISGSKIVAEKQFSALTGYIIKP